MLSQTYGRLYVKAKATNVSEVTVLYIAYDGCDRGFSANLFAESDDGQVEVGSKWRNPVLRCSQAVRELFLEPGETIEELEILNPPTEDFKKNHYVKVIFNKGK